MPDNPNVVIMVVKAGLGDTIPRPSNDDKPEKRPNNNNAS